MLGYTYCQTSLHECKYLIEMNLNRFTIFILLYKDDLISTQSTNQHRNVLEFFYVAVKKTKYFQFETSEYKYCQYYPIGDLKRHNARFISVQYGMIQSVFAFSEPFPTCIKTSL